MHGQQGSILPGCLGLQGVSPYQWQRGPQSSTFASGYMRQDHSARSKVCFCSCLELSLERLTPCQCEVLSTAAYSIAVQADYSFSALSCEREPPVRLARIQKM